MPCSSLGSKSKASCTSSQVCLKNGSAASTFSACISRHVRNAAKYELMLSREELKSAGCPQWETTCACTS